MKKVLCIVLLALLSVSLFAGIAPISQSIGNVVVMLKEGSVEALIQKALAEPYTEEWLETYALEKEVFAVAYTDALASLLPMENFILSSFHDGEIAALSLSDSKKVTFLMKEGRISALRID